jgi:hypothetical protein
MREISIVGLDLAKLVFQVHGADKAGRCLLRKQLKRREVMPFLAGLAPCVVAMEACGSAHYWAREIKKLGHQKVSTPYPREILKALAASGAGFPAGRVLDFTLSAQGFSPTFPA